MCKIFIEREYGWKYYIWNFPGSPKEALQYWKELSSIPPFHKLKGVMKEIPIELVSDILELTDHNITLSAHIHTDDDSDFVYLNTRHFHQGYTG